MKPEARSQKPETQRAGQAARPARRLLVSGFLFPVSCFLLGCMGLTGSRNPNPPPALILDKTPEPANLVRYLNDNAAKINSLESADLDLDVQAERSIGLSGSLFCQKPKNFRLIAKMPVAGSKAADFGSNSQEFWYWISQDRPPTLYHCAYSDLESGNVMLPFPLKPDWVLEALGMGAPAPVGTPEQEQARGRSFNVSKSSDNRFLYLTERTTSPQGQPVTKTTMFNNFNVAAGGKTPQVVAHYLYDSRNQIVCQATVIEVQRDAKTDAVVPRKVKLEWPAQKLALTLTLREVAVNSPKTDMASNPKLFTRPAMDNVPTFDLAHGTRQIARPLSIQRAGANR
jgi:hypothetical protein